MQKFSKCAANSANFFFDYSKLFANSRFYLKERCKFVVSRLGYISIIYRQTGGSGICSIAVPNLRLMFFRICAQNVHNLQNLRNLLSENPEKYMSRKHRSFDDKRSMEILRFFFNHDAIFEVVHIQQMQHV